MAHPGGRTVIEALLYATEHQVATVLVELVLAAVALWRLGRALTPSL